MKAHSAKRLLAVCILGALAGLTSHGQAVAADAHDRGHDAPALELNAGAKWQTDAPLRQGMSKIRVAVEQTLPAVHAGNLPTARYRALGETVDRQIAYIVKNCKLAPEADAVLHNVIAGLTEGSDVVSGRKVADDRSAGVVQLVKTLDSYGTYFDHAGWKPVEMGH